MTRVEALKTIVAERDRIASGGGSTFGPDQGFDDWAADLAERHLCDDDKCLGWVPGEDGIERCDSCAQFADDDEAREHVRRQLEQLQALGMIETVANAAHREDGFFSFSILQGDSGAGKKHFGTIDTINRARGVLLDLRGE